MGFRTLGVLWLIVAAASSSYSQQSTHTSQSKSAHGLDEALHLDSGFQRSKRDGFFPRFKDALIQNVTSRTTTGSRVFSVPASISFASLFLVFNN
jgi:hypothetical protein